MSNQEIKSGDNNFQKSLIMVTYDFCISISFTLAYLRSFLRNNYVSLKV